MSGWAEVIFVSVLITLKAGQKHQDEHKISRIFSISKLSSNTLISMVFHLTSNKCLTTSTLHTCSLGTWQYFRFSFTVLWSRSSTLTLVLSVMCLECWPYTVNLILIWIAHCAIKCSTNCTSYQKKPKLETNVLVVSEFLSNTFQTASVRFVWMNRLQSKGWNVSLYNH